MGMPILGRIEAPGQVEGGDCVWVDARTLAIGRGVRTNQDGIQQIANLLSPHGIAGLWLRPAALAWRGSLPASDVGDQPARRRSGAGLSPLLPAAFYQMLKARGIRLVEGDAEEFFASNGLSLNVLPTARAK